MTRPLVSAIVPVYDGRRFLGEALDAILAQDYPAVEVIVVDGGPGEGCADIAAKRAVRHVVHPNEGVAVARNLGLELANGELIAFCDQDDVWMPRKLDVQVAALLDRPGLGFVYGFQETFLEPGATWPDWLDRAVWSTPQPGYCPGTLLVRREVFDLVGAFDPRFASFSDGEWFIRARRAGVASEVVQEVVLRYRLHESNHSHDRDLFRTELLRALRRDAPVEAA